MNKNIFTYLLITALLSAVVLPTYFSLSEENCEVSLCINDIEEDSEGEEKTTKDLEIKIIYTNHTSLVYSYSSSIMKATYLSKEYSAIYRKLESPPPELLT